MKILILMIVLSPSIVVAQDASFSTCVPKEKLLMYMDGRLPQSYETGLTYKQGLKELLNISRQAYLVPANSESQSGYLTIRFIVNCKGESGDFELLEVDDDYHQFQFSKAIENQLLLIVKGLRDWIPGKNTRGESVDSQKFLTFKLSHGDLIEIVPK